MKEALAQMEISRLEHGLILLRDLQIIMAIITKIQ